MGRRTLSNTTVSYDPDALRPKRTTVPAEQTARSGGRHVDAKRRGYTPLPTTAAERREIREAEQEAEQHEAEERRERALQAVDRILGKAELQEARRRRNAAANKRNPNYRKN